MVGSSQTDPPSVTDPRTWESTHRILSPIRPHGLGRAMPSEQHKPHDPAILIWMPVGETPTRHAFAARGASTFSFLPDAVIHAQKGAAPLRTYPGAQV